MGLHSMSTLDSRLVLMLKQLNKYLNHFPRSEKYGLSLQIRNAAYEVYGLVVESQKRHHKKTSLSNLDIRHEQLRMLVRLAHELGYFQFKDGAQLQQSAEAIAERRHHALSKMIDEIGRLIGGWISAERAKERPASQQATRESS